MDSQTVNKKMKIDTDSIVQSFPDEMSQVLAKSKYEPDSVEFAKEMDAADPLREFRSKFLIPPTPKTATFRKNCKDSVYLCGNSLGLQPKTAREYVNEELDKWAEYGVEGHFAEIRPWVTIDELCTQQMAEIVGAQEKEVAIMNTLTVNLHLMLISFYKPTKERYKILMEAKAFPSDTHALTSQIKLHGFDPKDALIQMAPREGENYLRTEDIENEIKKNGNQIAVVVFSGVQYYTGQVFQYERIAQAAKSQGCKVGFDLAHAVGNIPLKLHDWNIDFACWCTYKYLNSGPGSIGGCFVHETYESNVDLPRLAGWWGHRKDDRFQMKDEFIPSVGAKGWQLSNPPVLPIACIRASLEIFAEAKMERLRNKSKSLTTYLEYLIAKMTPPGVCKVITPNYKHQDQRGCQLSLVFDRPVAKINASLIEEGVIGDKREPVVLRISPTPLYNTFEDVYEFVQTLNHVLKNV